MEERQSRIFLAVFLTMLVWFGLNFFLDPPKTPPKHIDPQTKTVDNANTNQSTGNPPTETKEIKDATITPTTPTEEIKKFHLITNSFLVEFSSEGGRIEKFYVKNYNDLDGKEVKIVKKDSDAIEFKGNKYKAIEISRGKGFDFNLGDDKEKIPSSIYNKISFKPTFNEQENLLIFEAESLDKKYLIRKEYKFFPQDNYFKFKLVLQNLTNEDLIVSNPEKPLYLRTFGSMGPVRFLDKPVPESEQMHYYRYYYLDGSFKDSIDSISSEGFFSNMFSGNVQNNDKRFEMVDGNIGTGIDFWGTGSRYFIGVLDALNHKPNNVLIDNRAGNETGVLAVYNSVQIKSGQKVEFDFAAYVGIREVDGMTFRTNELNPKFTKNAPFDGISDKLDKSFNQGLTTPFRNGIIWLLKQIHVITFYNYGWAIIVFGILFKLAFYPLNQKQADSMKKMQELNPQIQEINKKYEKDATKRQQMIMELYKKNKVNPMGGCLPMVIQIPIFVALYTAFSDVIDLWKTPFLWIPDLSEPDTVFRIPELLGMSIPLNILPLIMVATQFVQTKMTSVEGDPNQKTMMYIMPILMLYFFWSMPSGVTLYWTVQNILSIGQQLITNYRGKKANA